MPKITPKGVEDQIALIKEKMEECLEKGDQSEYRMWSGHLGVWERYKERYGR